VRAGRQPAVRADRRALLAQPDVAKQVARRSPVGNLYINRDITGAMVGRQPFGGTRLSGTGTRAGGPDYLMHFVEPRVVSENTTRHGLGV
jgi:RHH-type transcriptional regulator, proline utilization regulon repressor / proline dehydrogenase / delta 1-pyrroline-5-carboxylate dehydrogenase